jgi:hypothetical protein
MSVVNYEQVPPDFPRRTPYTPYPRMGQITTIPLRGSIRTP